MLNGSRKAQKSLIIEPFYQEKSVESPKFDEFDLIASICRDSFYEFVKEFWEEIIPEKPVWNWHIEFLCDEMQRVAERVFRGEKKLHDVIINISPGSTKSTICSVMFPPWVWTRMPSARILCASYAHPLALDLSRKSRDVATSTKYKQCFPEIELREDQNAKGYFQNTKGGMRYAIGLGGSVTGMHGHFLIPDDPIDPQMANSELELAAANTWVGETFNSRKVDKEVSVMIMVMQRLHQNDPTGNRLAKKGGSKVRHICIPAEITNDINPPYLKRFYVDGLMDPVRLSRTVLQNTQADIGQFGYAGQYLQSPVPLGGGMFKTDRFEIDVIPPDKQMACIVRYWDKAATKDGGAYTVGVKMGRDKHDPPRFYVMDVVRGQWSSEERERIIKKTAEMDGKHVRVGIEQEPGSSGKDSAEATARRLAGYRVFIDKVTGDKTERADTFSVQVNSGNVTLRKEAHWLEEYVGELRFFPVSTYKDQTDASSGAFGMCTKKRFKIGALAHGI